MTGYVYLPILKDIVNKMEKNHEDTEKYNQCKSIFKELWQYAPKHLKEYVFEDKKGCSFHSMFFSLFYVKNIDIVQLILADINDVQKKQIIFSNYGIKNCSVYLRRNQWHLLEMLIGHTLFLREEVECFKQALIKEKGVDIAVHFIQNEEWNKVEQFLQWAFKSDDDIRYFRQKLTYSRVCNDILESIVANNKADFTELEHFFKWCVSGDEERVVKCKAHIPEFYFRTLICKLIEEDKYELLDQILKLCFVYDQKQISQFKQNFYYDHENFVVKLVVNLIKQDEQLQSFEKFLHWCYTSEEEINKFKKCILHPTEDTVGLCVELLCEGMLKLADEFVSWYCNSSQIEIDNFKNQLMINRKVVYLSKRNDPKSFYETELIKWFNPSIETVIKFKEKFINTEWFKDVLSALDDYIKEQQHNENKSINKDVNNILQDLISAVAN